MTRRFHYALAYRVLPLITGLPLILVLYLALPYGTPALLSISITAFFVALTTAMLFYDHCALTDTDFCERKYFHTRQRIPISEISNISFLQIPSASDPTLVVVSKKAQTIKLPQVAYTKETLRSVVMNLLRANPNINTDTEARALAEMKASR